MELCFFTMSNNKRITWARRLVSSGDAVNRPIWFFRIPADHPDPKRYKVELLKSDLLPDADKYVYIDADAIMIQHGDWEATDCIGAKHEKWQTALKYSNYFPGLEGWGEYCAIYEAEGKPNRMNSGLVVLSANIRKDFAQRWQYWNECIDAVTSKRIAVRDQIGFAFVYKEFNLPILPERFCAIPKREKVTGEHILMHASGHPTGNAIKPYYNVVDRLLGGTIGSQPLDKRNVRWQVLTDLLVRCAEDSAHPTMLENGVFKGETTRHMLDTFPGLLIHCVDNRKPVGAEKRHKDTEAVWEVLCQEYGDRIINYCMDALDVELPQQVDLIFEDSDHRTEAVIAHAKHFWPMLKVGGFYVVHDINYRGTYYKSDSVRKAMDILFPKRYKLGPDHTAWTIKKAGQKI